MNCTGILLSCAASSNPELCAMATAKLHTLIQTRCMKDAEEGGYLLYYINTIVQQSLQGWFSSSIYSSKSSP